MLLQRSRSASPLRQSGRSVRKNKMWAKAASR
jgi:hypothetical protein